MKSLSISGVSFYPDDTVEVVRQLFALKESSHPARMFMECLVQLDFDHYSSNPKNWTSLFHRLSTDGRTVTESAIRTYITQIRSDQSDFAPRAFTLDEWSEPIEELRDLHSPGAPFTEWRVFGVPEEESVILSLPPKDTLLPSARIPIPHSQRLFESVHPEEILDIRVTQFVEGMSENVRFVYFPVLRDDTPANLSGIESAIRSSRKLLSDLFALRAPKEQASTVLKAKWFVPLVSTKIGAPRTRFEQIFYGLTVSKETPYIAYFTAKTEVIRSKFYVEDPKKKVPFLDTAKLRGWIARTLPQRRRPTLLLYRGKSNTHFDRIAITETDITFQSERDRDSKETLDDLQKNLLSWFNTFDAVTPFFVDTDTETDRWNLSELSLAITYAKGIDEFNMNRFHCLHPIFGVQDNKFRLLRADQTEGEVPMEVIQTYQYLQQDPNPEFVAEQMNVSLERARELIGKVVAFGEDFNFEKYVKQYPTVQFFKKDAYVRFVTDIDRVIEYVNLLRYVLTSGAADVETVCPERLQEAAPVMAVAQGELRVDVVDEEAERDLLAGLYEPEELPGAPAAAAPASAAPVKRKMEIASKQATTYNYFNNRVKKFDAETFDQTFYNSECEKLKQVVVLTPEDKARIGPTYNYDKAPDAEKLELDDPEGTAICPPYWCMRDEIPLRKEQLKLGEDGILHCPQCGGKVRPNDSVNPAEFTVIERDQAAKFPDAMKRLSTKNGRKVPCCYVREPKKQADMTEDKKGGVSYILQQDAPIVPELRAAYLSPSLAAALKVKTNYDKTVVKGKIVLKESDVFRIGLGRPSRSLPVLFGNKVQIPRPRDNPDAVKKCSFFLTRRNAASGDTPVERVLEAIDRDYEEGNLTILEEVEYVTTFLECEVIRVDISTNQVLCGFWSDTIRGTKNTIALLGDDILGVFGKSRVGRTYQPSYSVNLTKSPFARDTLPYLRNLSKEACNVGIPTYDDAVHELQRLGKASYEVILDPFKRTQALFVAKEVVLPILPVLRETFEGIPVRDGYYDIKDDELPSRDAIVAAYADSKHPGYKVVTDHANVYGATVEVELSSGFRVPVYPVQTEAKKPTEVLETVYLHSEDSLVYDKPKAEDIKLAETTTYKSEIIEFLLYSISKDIQTEDYVELRMSIENSTETLEKDLDAWFEAEGYMDTADSPIQFINKVRTPCGQLTNKDTCNKSSLCGWHRGDCKIRVNPVFEKRQLLRAVAKILRQNPKKRALVLDGILSPFFSTVLYLEMPNELITTSF